MIDDMAPGFGRALFLYPGDGTSVAVFRIGQRLAEARDLFKYKRDVGGFEGWCEQRIGWSEQQAHRLIGIHEKLGGKANELVSLSREALFQLAAPSTTPEVREAVTEKVKAGETVTESG